MQGISTSAESKEERNKKKKKNISKAKILKYCNISKIYTKKGERKEYTSNYSNKTKTLLFSILS
jgi:hypothetical protein